MHYFRVHCKIVPHADKIEKLLNCTRLQLYQTTWEKCNSAQPERFFLYLLLQSGVLFTQNEEILWLQEHILTVLAKAEYSKMSGLSREGVMICSFRTDSWTIKVWLRVCRQYFMLEHNFELHFRLEIQKHHEALQIFSFSMQQKS